MRIVVLFGVEAFRHEVLDRTCLVCCSVRAFGMARIITLAITRKEQVFIRPLRIPLAPK